MVTQNKPDWLTVKLKFDPKISKLKALRSEQGLATVCEEARCPNLNECWSGGTATFMLMGDTCTRGCRFCHVTSGNPNGWLDTEEPTKLAKTVAEQGWQYVVLTSVDRDDLPDGGAAHFAETVRHIRKLSADVKVEVLIPDFQGNDTSLNTLMAGGPIADGPHVIAHNIETVEALSELVRDRRASYQQSLELLQRVKAKDSTVLTKSSIMLGLGESDKQVHQALNDLRAANVDVVTLGQYLQPSPKHLPVEAYIHPDTFATWKAIAETEYDFRYCASGPLVRSSYRAGELLLHHWLTPGRH